jgi:hypothetical protein
MISREVMDETKEYLKFSTRAHTELVILWSGLIEDKVARVVSVWLPKQYVNSGFFEIPGDELFELNKAIYERGERLIAQVHTHPTLAFHSDVDSEFAVTAMEGGLSIVVPDFGQTPLDSLSKCAYFRFHSGRWGRLSRTEARSLVRFG